MSATTTIRIYPETRERLRQMARSRRTSTAKLLDELASDAEERELLTQFNASFSDHAAAGAYHESETRALDGTAGDGLGGDV